MRQIYEIQKCKRIPKLPFLIQRLSMYKAYIVLSTNNYLFMKLKSKTKQPKRKNYCPIWAFTQTFGR